MGIVAYLLFFLAGLGFGFAAAGKWKWIPIVFPVFLWLGAVLVNGIDAASLLRLIVALALTVAGILLGAALDSRSRGEPSAQTG